MRQAGRYMPEYRAVRERYSFLDLCKDADAAADVTVTAVERLGVDAAIILRTFCSSVEPMGVGLEFTKGDGPVLHHPCAQPPTWRECRRSMRRPPCRSCTMPYARQRRR